jgi:hypothetical protein
MYRMKKLLLSISLIFAAFSANAQNIYSYGFNSPTATMIGADGWTRTNQSTLPSTTSLWTVGTYATSTASATNQGVFQNQVYATGATVQIPNGQAGGANSFALVNYTSTTSTAATGATISNWLISPIVSVQNGDIVTFYTRIGKYSATGEASFADRLQLRMSTAGAFSSDPTGGPTGVGDYTNLLVDVNPNLDLTSYPTTWGQFSYTVSGLAGPTDVKFAFRYFVTNGGANGSNSDIIGIDTFSVDRPVANTQEFFAGNFAIQPNPVTDVFTLNAKNGVAIEKVEVLDINGRIVNQVNGSSTDAIQVNVSELNSGVYFVRVQSDLGVGTSKIIKN